MLMNVKTMFGVLVFVSLISIASLQTPPYIAQTLVTTNLNENDDSGKQLVCIPCTHTAPITVRLVSPNGVTSTGPTTHCINCFSVHQVSPVSDYCLFYEKLSGGVEFAAARGYVVTVECTDGSASTQAVINVNIIPNQYPVFSGSSSVVCPTPMNVAVLAVNAPVYTIRNVNDYESDAIYYNLTTYPDVDNFEIGLDGIIRVKTVLTNLCFPTITFFVSVRDSRDANPSPLVITCPLQNYYTRPQLTNANRQTTAREHLPVGDTIYTFWTSPPTVSLTYQLTTVVTSLQTFFSVTGNNLVLNQKLDAEDANMDLIKINIKISNGFCPASDFYIEIRVIDENDAPMLIPKDFSVTFQEGVVITVDANFGITDQDVGDGHIFSIVSGNDNGLFRINPTSGVITSTVTWDVDGGLHPGSVTLGIEVVDTKSGNPTGDKDSATVRITIEDIDDNPPIFTQAAFVFHVFDCTPPGIIGSITATDSDSSFNNNNFIVYDSAEDTNVRVFPDGQVFLKVEQSIGTSAPLTVTAHGNGASPKVTPWSAQIILTVENCTLHTTTSASSGGGNSSGSRASDSIWMDFLAFFAIMLGLTSD